MNGSFRVDLRPGRDCPRQGLRETTYETNPKSEDAGEGLGARDARGPKNDHSWEKTVIVFHDPTIGTRVGQAAKLKRPIRPLWRRSRELGPSVIETAFQALKRRTPHDHH